MKLLSCMMITLCFSLIVKAQNNDLFKRNPVQEYKFKMLLHDSLQRLYPAHPSVHNFPPVEPGVLKFSLKGRFIGKNGKGDELYSMQPDNMTCLVPNKEVHLNMPVAGAELYDKKLLPLLSKPDDRTVPLDKGKQHKQGD